VSNAEVVLFDLGGVLLPFDRERRVRTLSRALRVTPDAARAFMDRELHQRLDLGLADEAELTDAVSDLAGSRVPRQAAIALILSVFEAPNVALWEHVAGLTSRARVGGFSDNPAFVREVFPDGHGLDPMFWSAELGMTKADARAYAAVEARLGVNPAGILLIDDSIANVSLARDIGWDAIHFRANSQLIAELAERGFE
jgi:HAD superfamily hydrolase (TIGR01509 family)